MVAIRITGHTGFQSTMQYERKRHDHSHMSQMSVTNTQCKSSEGCVLFRGEGGEWQGMKEWKIKRWMKLDGRQKRGMVRDNENQHKQRRTAKGFTESNGRSCSSEWRDTRLGLNLEASKSHCPRSGWDIKTCFIKTCEEKEEKQRCTYIQTTQ